MDVLEKWTDRNLRLFNKGKHKVLHQGRNNPRHQNMLGAAQLEISLAEMDLGVLVDSKLTTSQPCAYLQRRLIVSQAAFGDKLEGDQGR